MVKASHNPPRHHQPAFPSVQHSRPRRIAPHSRGYSGAMRRQAAARQTRHSPGRPHQHLQQPGNRAVNHDRAPSRQQHSPLQRALRQPGTPSHQKMAHHPDQLHHPVGPAPLAHSNQLHPLHPVRPPLRQSVIVRLNQKASGPAAPSRSHPVVHSGHQHAAARRHHLPVEHAHRQRIALACAPAPLMMTMMSAMKRPDPLRRKQPPNCLERDGLIACSRSAPARPTCQQLRNRSLPTMTRMRMTRKSQPHPPPVYRIPSLQAARAA